MTTDRQLSPAEAAVLEAHLPKGTTESMAELAWCLYAAQALEDERAGTRAPDASWLAELSRMAQLATRQISYISAEMGGAAIYLSRALLANLTARDERLCAEFRGDNYRELASRYDLSEMRVRQIIAEWRRRQIAERQGRLPGLDD